jgi:hypothetical protein
MLQQFIDFISKPWLGSTLGFVGLAVAIIFYLRSKRKTRIAYQRDAVSIVGGGSAAFPDELEIRFAGDAVPRVTSDRIVLWNAGNTTIGGSQIVESDPLRIELSAEEAILKAWSLKVTREVNACRLEPSPDSPAIAKIKFDFLDPGDGMAFEVLHTGTRTSCSILGTIRGMPSGISNFGRVSGRSDQRFKKMPFPFSKLGRRTPLYIALVFGIGMIVFGVFRPQISEWEDTRKPEKEEKQSTARWAIILGGVLYVAMPAWMLWMRRRRYPTALSLEVELAEDNNTKPNKPAHDTP